MPFDLQSPLDNAEMGAFFADLFRFFNITGVIDTRNQVTQRLRPLMRADMRDFFAEGNPTRPAFYVATDSAIQVVIIDGVKTTAQANGLILGYNNTTGTFSFQGRNPWLQNAGRNIAGTCSTQNSFLDAPKKLIVGYSAGGAIALWVAKSRGDFDVGADIRILSFGSPRS